MAAWYEDWFRSAYYAKLYAQRNEKEVQDFIQQLLPRLKVQSGSRMLDTACGRGSYSRLLAASGLDVTGVDLAAENIAAAILSSPGTIHFYQHDIRLPAWVAYFDCAVNLNTSFGYFGTQREHDNAVRSISQSLKPGGTLVFDYLNVHYAEDQLQHNEIVQIDETHFEIHRWHDRDHFYKRITVTDEALEKPFEVTETIAKFSLGDFTDMLSYQQMQISDVFGDYHLRPYHVRTAPHMIILAKKR